MADKLSGVEVGLSNKRSTCVIAVLNKRRNRRAGSLIICRTTRIVSRPRVL